ncbi:MAG: sulfotransferase [Actinobacteria bacterium]|nr:sulfotransferase [Actinomycetota bacterium]
MSGGPQKVLLIVGRGRSGSTILDNMLGELDGFFSVGELHNLWKRGLVRGHTCGCGRPLAECPIWTSVLETAERDLGGSLPTPNQVQGWQDQFVRPSDTRRLLRKKRGDPVAGLSRYLSVLDSVYGALFEVTGARVIVDSSKRPSHAALFHLLSGVTPFFVQLVRDPRAVSYSRTRVKPDEVDQREMRRDGTLRSAFKWWQRNAEAESVRRKHPAGRSLTVRYEDLVSDPAGTIESIARLVDETPADLPFEGPKTVRLGENHTAAGNPSRFKKGLITLREDDEWVHRQNARDQWITTIISLGLLKRYGYPVIVPARLE